MEHIGPTVEKVMCDTLVKVLEEVQRVVQAHNNELIELWKRIDIQDKAMLSLWNKLEELERRVNNEM